MIKWQKKGRIFCSNDFDLPWFTKNGMVPLPFIKSNEILRIFVTMCDDRNIGRIGYVDVDPMCPERILGYSHEPVLDIGEDGKFDDNGVVTASLYSENGKLYMLYSGYQSCLNVPYMIYAGIAVSMDNGDSFTKLTRDVPLLDRIDGEWGTRCVPTIRRENGCYKMWYTADSAYAWCVGDNGKKEPYYDLKYMESAELLSWPRQSHTALSFANAGEHGIGMGTIWRQGGEYHLIFTLRTLDGSSRLGYATSVNGKNFIRKDNGLLFLPVGNEVTAERADFDVEMMCYPERLTVCESTYLFYSGNHYGRGGVGYAVQV